MDVQTDIRTEKRTDGQTARQTDRQIFFLFWFLRHTKHEHLSKGDISFIFFPIFAFTIFSLFTYSVCDEKVKNWVVLLCPTLISLQSTPGQSDNLVHRECHWSATNSRVPEAIAVSSRLTAAARDRAIIYSIAELRYLFRGCDSLARLFE